MKLRVGDVVEYVSDDVTNLKGSIGIVRSRSALMATVDWVSQSPNVHHDYDIRVPRKFGTHSTFYDKDFSRITNIKETPNGRS